MDRRKLMKLQGKISDILNEGSKEQRIAKMLFDAGIGSQAFRVHFVAVLAGWARSIEANHIENHLRDLEREPSVK